MPSPVFQQPALASAVWANPLLNSTAAQQSAACVVEAFASVGGSTTFFTMDSYTEFFDTFIAPNTDVSLWKVASCISPQAFASVIRQTSSPGQPPNPIQQIHG